ncbi:MAG: MOSC domain-containing protein [Janthinobacterium lividum]
MATLTALTLYPIKSCGGISVQQATLQETGLAVGAIGDREWMLVDHAGQFLTQRELPAMATLRPVISALGLHVHAPGCPPLQIDLNMPPAGRAQLLAVGIWKDRLDAIDCGEAAARWFSTALSNPCRLVRFASGARRLADAAWSNGQQVPTLFSDGFPILVISEASLADLNRRLLQQARPALPMARFRPNIVLGGVDEFEEDFAATLDFGQAVLKPTKPCPRCAIPSVDQQSGRVGPDPLDILQTYRAMDRIGGGIAFGINAIVQSGAGASLRVGQEVGIELAF